MKKGRTKILIAINSDVGKTNKIGDRFGYIYRNLIKEGFDVKILARKNYTKEIPVVTPFYKNYISKGQRALKMFFPFMFKISIDRLLFDKFIYKNIFNENFDLVHIQHFNYKSINFLKSKNCKVFFEYSMSLLENVPEQLIQVLNLADHIIVPSVFTKESIKSAGIKANIITVPFGVNSNKFKPLTEKDNDAIKFAFAGDLSTRKGVDFLLDAWRDLGVNYEKIELNLYGRIRWEIKEHLKNKVDLNVRTHGFVDTSKELPKNNIFIFPSNREGSAKAIYEAMACGLPIITTPNSGSVIRDGEEGFIIPPKDTEAIKEKILYFYNNPEKIEEMGKKARKLAEEYTWERYAENVYNVYKKVLDSN